jgi:hypothetical protein
MRSYFNVKYSSLIPLKELFSAQSPTTLMHLSHLSTNLKFPSLYAFKACCNFKVQRHRKTKMFDQHITYRIGALLSQHALT